MEVHACNLNTWEAEEGQGHLRICSEFKASLDYMRSCLKKKKITLSHCQLNTILSIYDAGGGTRPQRCSDPHILFRCVSTLVIIPMTYTCGMPSVREALGRQHIAEVLEGSEVEQNFERGFVCPLQWTDP